MRTPPSPLKPIFRAINSGVDPPNRSMYFKSILIALLSSMNILANSDWRLRNPNPNDGPSVKRDAYHCCHLCQARARYGSGVVSPKEDSPRFISSFSNSDCDCFAISIVSFVAPGKIRESDNKFINFSLSPLAISPRSLRVVRPPMLFMALILEPSAMPYILRSKVPTLRDHIPAFWKNAIASFCTLLRFSAKVSGVASPSLLILSNNSPILSPSKRLIISFIVGNTTFTIWRAFESRCKSNMLKPFSIA